MVRRVLARLQRTEAPNDTELQQPYISPQEDQDWNWPERNSEEVRVEGHEEAHLWFFSTEEWYGGKREEHDAGGNKGFGGTSNEDTVFPDDEIRNHDDRTGKYHNNILGRCRQRGQLSLDKE